MLEGAQFELKCDSDMDFAKWIFKTCNPISHQKVLKIKNVTKALAGTYSCLGVVYDSDDYWIFMASAKVVVEGISKNDSKYAIITLTTKLKC